MYSATSFGYAKISNLSYIDKQAPVNTNPRKTKSKTKTTTFILRKRFQ